MSEVLARLRVRETHGIRRFLYPLSAVVNLPEDTDLLTLGWAGTRGDAVPLQLSPLPDGASRLDFALSLAPMEERQLEVVAGGFQFPVPDPLHIRNTPDGGLHSEQERLSFDIRPNGEITQVVYDGVSHLREPSQTTNLIYAGSATPAIEASRMEQGPLITRLETRGTYTIDHMTTAGRTIEQGKMPFSTLTEITACKSWVKRTLRYEEPRNSGTAIFDLELSPSTLPLLYDFGVGGGVYGHLQAGDGTELRAEATQEGVRRWKIVKGQSIGSDAGYLAGREDYQGHTSNPGASELWFHIVDSDKSLAVMLTEVPNACDINILLTGQGRVQIACIGRGDTPAQFGVCYHFLNDVPAIAAATNPQSILLPPTVEVVPI